MSERADPRPRVDGGRLHGSRCPGCGYALAEAPGRCFVCGTRRDAAVFESGGVVWSSTVVRVRVGDRTPPYAVAVVDVDDGPRILAHLEHAELAAPGSRVELIGTTSAGDPRYRVMGGVGPVVASSAAPVATQLEGSLRGVAVLDRPVGIAGVGTSSFGAFVTRRLEELAWEAIEEAIADAGIQPGDIDAVWLGSVFCPGAMTPRILRGAGIAGIPTMRVENACASGTTALHEAISAVGSGRYETVLALGIEQLSTVFDGPIVPDLTDPDGATGLALPALYGLQANRYLAEHPHVRIEDLAAVAVKNKANGSRNPRAQIRTPSTLEQVLASRVIADPLTLLQCCPLGDGAAAAIVSSRESPVEVRASALASGAPWDQRTNELWGSACVRRAAAQAFGAAGVSIAEVDVLEVHDAFTIGEVSTLEALGMAAPGEGAALATSGRSCVGGTKPVNPSGGLLARGHPLGATGLAQTAEIIWQLRGMAGPRQVRGARIGVVETMGGGAAGVDGNAAVVAVFEAR